MPWLTDLAIAARSSGLQVVEVAGWRTRGHGPMAGVRSIAIHHTATSARATGDYPTLRVVRDGYAGLPGPLSQLGLGRSGVVYVIAAGRSYHAGTTWQTRQANSWSIGIEAEHSGSGPWPQVQYQAYVRLVAALAKHYRVPVAHIEGHKEIAKPKGRKSDPNFSMPVFRSAVSAAMAGRPTAPAAPAAGGQLTVTGQLDTPTVRELQAYLNAADLNRRPNIAVDGRLGPATTAKLQWMIGTHPDGIFGARSARAAEAWLGLPATTVGGFYPGLIRGLQRRVNGWIEDGRRTR